LATIPNVLFEKEKVKKKESGIIKKLNRSIWPKKIKSANPYKIPTPTYAFSSVPTSINEGANGTFNVTTTDVANGTALYWTINNVTTGSGDFV
jgi:hypothetical protein